MFENYPPVEEGFLRCATVQSEAMLAKLLSEGTYQPSRSELSPHSMTAGCPKCENDAQWCWHEAYTWMYEQCAERLNMPEMDAGIWLYAHDEEIHNFKEAYNHGLGKEGMVLLIVDIPKRSNCSIRLDTFSSHSTELSRTFIRVTGSIAISMRTTI
jgi:hypothetical protein